MLKIFPVGWDGAMTPVLASDKREAEFKLSVYLKREGYRINRIFAHEPSKSYNDWVEKYKLNVLR